MESYSIDIHPAIHSLPLIPNTIKKLVLQYLSGLDTLGVIKLEHLIQEIVGIWILDFA
jgi:hypothetical protein